MELRDNCFEQSRDAILARCRATGHTAKRACPSHLRANRTCAAAKAKSEQARGGDLKSLAERQEVGDSRWARLCRLKETRATTISPSSHAYNFPYQRTQKKKRLTKKEGDRLCLSLFLPDTIREACPLRWLF